MSELADYHRYLDQVFALLLRSGTDLVRNQYGTSTEYARDRDDEQPELRCPVCGRTRCPLDVRGRL